MGFVFGETGMKGRKRVDRVFLGGNLPFKFIVETISLVSMFSKYSELILFFRVEFYFKKRNINKCS